MAKKKKTGEEKRLMKLRAALRLLWSRDYSHKAAIDAVVVDKKFTCPHCLVVWDKFAARVDHHPPLGEFKSLNEAAAWMIRLFESPTRVLCKPCHDKVTASQRKKKSEKA